jgi:hypothetical protein
MNKLSIYIEAKNILVQLIDTINELTFDEYTMPIEALGNSTIGQHSRHIIELFQKLNEDYLIGSINYDKRERSKTIEINIDFAIECIANVISKIEKQDKKLLLMSDYSTHNKIETSYYRELIYNIEHCIHHQAIIKIGHFYIGKELKNENFGVAKSTINYRQACAQ